MLAVALLLAPKAAHACFEPAVGPRNAVSLRVPTLFAHGGAVVYERFLPNEASVAFGLAVRKSAGGDYASTTVTGSAEARYWMLGEGPFGCRGRYEMIGPFISAKLDVGRTSLRDTVEDRSIGASWSVRESAWLGWRFAIGHAEITPSAATIVRTEIGDSLARQTTVSVGYDLTIGWMF